MSEELLRENERLKASNHRLEVEAIQRQGEFDSVRLAANRCDLENERIKSELKSKSAAYTEADDQCERQSKENEQLRARVVELDKAFEGMSWQRMYLAPKDGTAFLAMLEGSDCPVTIRAVGKKWLTTFDQYELSDADGPRCWMPIPSSAL